MRTAAAGHWACRPSVPLLAGVAALLAVALSPAGLRRLAASRGQATDPNGIAYLKCGVLRIREGHTGQGRVLAGSEFPVDDLSVSPDGRLIAFDEDCLLVTVDSWTNRRWRLPSDDRSARLLCWSSDSSTIAYAGADGQLCLWRVRAGSCRQLTHDSNAFYSSAAWSPRGDLIATVRQTGDQIEEYGQLRLVSARSGLARNFNPSGGWKLGSWSPNGDRIAAIRATSASGDNPSVVVLGRDGKLSVLKGAEPEEVQWAPEGERIAIVRFLHDTGPQGGEFEDELTIVDAATGTERLLRAGQPKGALMWHAGAEKLLFTEWVGGHEPSVWEADLRSGHQQLVAREAESGQYCTMPRSPWSRARGQRVHLLVRQFFEARSALGIAHPA